MLPDERTAAPATSAATAELVRFWQTQLAQAPELLSLPYDFPRSAAQQAHG